MIAFGVDNTSGQSLPQNWTLANNVSYFAIGPITRNGKDHRKRRIQLELLYATKSRSTLLRPESALLSGLDQRLYPQMYSIYGSARSGFRKHVVFQYLVRVQARGRSTRTSAYTNYLKCDLEIEVRAPPYRVSSLMVEGEISSKVARRSVECLRGTTTP
jgi:hypothetical protein